ncbi:MAG: tetratricopeptide repeat protein [Candidatus Lokiarchaeota archaeon]|nr:tetratricopeptide repeat protein [Candidatus Lokiarchaeota archaeon]
MDIIDKNLVYKLKTIPINIYIQYRDLNQLFVKETDEKYDLLVSRPAETLNLNLPYVTNLAYHEDYPFLILIDGKTKQKIALKSAHIQTLYVTNTDSRAKVNLNIEYEILAPHSEVLQFFGIIVSDWLKIHLRFRNYKEKLIQQIYSLIDPGLKEHVTSKRCKDCKSLMNNVKTSDAQIYEIDQVCPSCLRSLSKSISQIKLQVDAFSSDYCKLSSKHESLIKTIDNTLIFSVKHQEDTSKLYLGYLKSKLMINTQKFHMQGLQAMLQIFDLISDYEYVKKLNLPPEFDEDVENCLIQGYVENKRHVEALRIAEIGYELNRKAQNTFKMAKSLNRLSEIYLSLNQYDDAQECAEQSYDLHVKNRFTGQSLEKSAEILTRIYKIKNLDDKIRNVKLHRFFKE